MTVEAPRSAADGVIADLRLALDAVVRAGERVALDFGGAMDVRMKSADQPVTPADIAVDRALRERLLGERPAYGWLSEETRDDARRLECTHVWIVDPIDGTSSFIAGHPDSVVVVGLADGQSGHALLGVVFNPLTGELYWAVRGGGAYGVVVETARHVEADAAIHGLVRVPAVDAIGPDGWGRYMIVQDANAPPRTPARAFVSRSDEHDGAALPPDWIAVPRGSTAYKMVGVASGAAEVYYASGSKSEWDLCGPSIIVEEAGGRVTDGRGDPLRFNRADTHVSGLACASDERFHAELMSWRGST